MSKAFVRDDAPADEPEPPVDESDAPITVAGFDHLAARLSLWRRERAEHPDRAQELDRRIRALARRMEHLVVARDPPSDPTRVSFGAAVTVEDDDGAARTLRIVGPDEVELHPGGVSVTSPVARALLGRRVGEVVTIPRPRGAREVTLVAIERD